SPRARSRRQTSVTKAAPARDERCAGFVPGLAEKSLRDIEPLGRNGLQLRGRLRERDVDDAVATQRGHLPEPPLVDEVGGLQAVAGRQDTVARRRRAAALHVAEDGHARLVAGPLLDELREPVADAAGREPDVAELVDLVLGTG